MKTDLDLIEEELEALTYLGKGLITIQGALDLVRRVQNTKLKQAKKEIIKRENEI